MGQPRHACMGHGFSVQHTMRMACALESTAHHVHGLCPSGRDHLSPMLPKQPHWPYLALLSQALPLVLMHDWPGMGMVTAKCMGACGL